MLERAFFLRKLFWASIGIRLHAINDRLREARPIEPSYRDLERASVALLLFPSFFPVV
jgi:hypothetical protein